MKLTMAVLAFLVTLNCGSVTRADDIQRGTVQGSAIMRKANRAPRDRALQERQLAAIDRELAKSPKEWDLHFARGLLLSRVGRLADAVAAFDATLKLNPKFAEAQYEAGITLMEMRKPAEAAVRLDAAGALDPGFFMLAAYNAGQAYYDNKEFKKALDRWSSAGERAPGDFDTTKKVLQAQNALGLTAEAATTREALVTIWKTSTDARVRGLKDFVFDQFDVGTRRVMAFETLDPKGDLYEKLRQRWSILKDDSSGVRMSAAGVSRRSICVGLWDRSGSAAVSGFQKLNGGNQR